MYPPLRECSYCELPIPAENDPEDAYCNDACLYAHVDKTLREYEQKSRFIPHNKNCCCIYC